MKSFCFATLLFATAVKASGDEEPASSCACEAEELSFSIDCSDGSLLTDTLASLIQDGCSTNCASEACKKNFLIIQSHSDFCLQDDVPGSVEDAAHDYAKVCGEGCAISRKRDPNLTNCPVPVCDKRGEDAYIGMLMTGCLTDCSSTDCASNYKILRSEYDNCPDNTLSDSVVTGIRNVEQICAASNCNSLMTEKSVAEQLICTTEKSTLGAGAIVGIVIGSVVGAFLIAGAIYLYVRTRRMPGSKTPGIQVQDNTGERGQECYSVKTKQEEAAIV